MPNNMTSLPNDIARCAGVNNEGYWREGCEDCLRRTLPLNGDQVSWIDPPAIIAFWCEFIIEPIEL